jgi:hypothetical protein
MLFIGMMSLPWGLTRVWRGDLVFLGLIVGSIVLWVATHRTVFGVALLSYIAVFLIATMVVISSVNPKNPYVRHYNERLERIATEAGLVGDSEERVEEVLGPATHTYSGWDCIVSATGEPALGARYGTTYNYAPFPSFPFSKFQVHCEDGKVQSIELYDD